jgi:hypothetical protein
MFGAFHGGLVALGFATFTRGVPTEQLPVVTRSASPASPTTLRVATLNLAHGRSTGRNQVLQSSARPISQVHAAAALVSGGIAARSRPPGGRRSGLWSGGVDRPSLVAVDLEAHAFAGGRHVDGFGLQYGTAVVFKLAMRGADSYTFETSPPTPSRGWVVALLVWPAAPGGEVQVASVHFDFSRSSVRARQIASSSVSFLPRSRVTSRS